MIIVREKKHEDTKDIAQIILQAFGSKFSKAFNFDLKILEEMLIYTLKDRGRSKTLVAVEDSRILGFIKLQSKRFDKKGEKIRLNRLIKKFGIINSIKFKIGTIPLDYLTIKRNELYVSQLAVDKEGRGRGVGSLLLEAGEKECSSLLNSYTLYVMKENKGAFKLYKKRGFNSTRILKFPFFKALTGYTAAIYMTKSIMA